MTITLNQKATSLGSILFPRKKQILAEWLGE